MNAPIDWQSAFVAVSALLGEPLEVAMAALPFPPSTGATELLSRELGLPVWAHEETASRVSVPVARRLEDGDLFALDGPVPQRWRVLHTPGHAAGHVCLLD